MNNEISKLVCIVCISMNHEDYIEQSIKSIIEQTYKNIEIFYLDNNSQDESFEKSKQLLEISGKPFFAVKREKSYTISANLNYLIRKSKADYFCIISCDDWMNKDNVLEKMKLLNSNPSLAVIYSNGYYYNQKIGDLFPIYDAGMRDKIEYDNLLIRNDLIAVGNVVRRAALSEVGYFDENSNIEDWDLWIRISKNYQIGYIEKHLVFYRYFHNNISLNEEYMWKGFNYIYKKYSNEFIHSKNRKKIKEAFYERHRRYVNFLSVWNPTLPSVLKLICIPKFKSYYFASLVRWVLFFSKKSIFGEKSIFPKRK